jgi:1,4-alpha-glucan branching enzyme
VGVPKDGLWREVLNTNAKTYGGDGSGNPADIAAQPVKWDGRDFAVDVFLPGMSVMFFLPAGVEKPILPQKAEANVPEQKSKAPAKSKKTKR